MSIYFVLSSVSNVLSVPLGSMLTTALFQYSAQHTEKSFLGLDPTQFNKEAIKKFGLASLQGTVFAAAALVVSFKVGDYVYNDNDAKKYGWSAVLCTMAVCGLAAGIAARAFPHRLGTPTEVLTNFAVSSVLVILRACITGSDDE